MKIYRQHMSFNYILAFIVAIMVTACASTSTPISYFDFGTRLSTPAFQKPAQCQLPAITVAPIAAIDSLDSNLMLYRLQYVNDQQFQAYANHRWNMTPARLVEGRLKLALMEQGVNLSDNGSFDSNRWQLRLELTEFSQMFSDSQHSVAQLQMRTTLHSAPNVNAQHLFTVSVIAATPDAVGGAAAMRDATDQFIEQLTAWVCQQNQP